MARSAFTVVAIATAISARFARANDDPYPPATPPSPFEPAEPIVRPSVNDPGPQPAHLAAGEPVIDPGADRWQVALGIDALYASTHDASASTARINPIDIAIGYRLIPRLDLSIAAAHDLYVGTTRDRQLTADVRVRLQPMSAYDGYAILGGGLAEFADSGEPNESGQLSPHPYGEVGVGLEHRYGVFGVSLEARYAIFARARTPVTTGTPPEVDPADAWLTAVALRFAATYYF